jgi:hypothetical protein
VREAIEEHVRSRIAEVARRYDSAAEDEDTFTGQLGGLLGAGERKVDVDGRPWYWSIDYTKFRGRGKDATETQIGADGIFQIRVRGVEVEGQKSVLFQSKMGKPGGRQAKEQALVMSNWREASVFLSYEREGISVFSLDQVLAGDFTARETFSDFFLDRYLQCYVGDSDLTYDARARILHWRDEKGDSVAAKFRIPQRLRVNIRSPLTVSQPLGLIDSSEIHEHRMDSSPMERLGLAGDFDPADLKRAKKSVARLYHPDRARDLVAELKAIMNRRMAEMNDAYAKIREDKKWKR